MFVSQHLPVHSPVGVCARGLWVYS